MKRLIITQGLIENNIFLIRGQKIMIDRDLAKLYGVETKYLNRQVKRNIGRFPGEFMFQLNPEEKNELVTKCHRFETMKQSSFKAIRQLMSVPGKPKRRIGFHAN